MVKRQKVKESNFIITRSFQCIITWMLLVIFLHSNASAEIPEDYVKMWKDPDVTQQINDNIETFRKGDAVITLLDTEGSPAANVEVEVEQLTHEFLFGCNIFMLGGFKTDKQNKAYESQFINLFNFATAPFYWSDLEPQQGQIRFEKNSKPIYRRPPPDLVLEFAKKNNITLVGHPLIWHQWYPKWLPKDQKQVTALTTNRFVQIAERYAENIKIWDVVNEALSRPPGRILPKDYVAWSMKEADKHFRHDNNLRTNEATGPSHNYRQEDSPYYLQLLNLKLREVRFDSIGFQFHIFSENRYKDIIRGKSYTPQQLLKIYDLYCKFNKPLHISEITIPTFGTDKQSQQDQAELVEHFYKLWFSVPQMAAITWWNLADGTAVGKENDLRAGLLNEELKPKESYRVLDRLINNEWRTKLTGKTDDKGRIHFRGFYGKYSVKVKSVETTQDFEINLSKGQDSSYKLTCSGGH